MRRCAGRGASGRDARACVNKTGQTQTPENVFGWIENLMPWPLDDGTAPRQNSELRIRRVTWKSSPLAQARQQFVVDLIKFAIGKNRNDITVVEIGNQPVDNFVGAG